MRASISLVSSFISSAEPSTNSHSRIARRRSAIAGHQPRQRGEREDGLELDDQALLVDDPRPRGGAQRGEGLLGGEQLVGAFEAVAPHGLARVRQQDEHADHRHGEAAPADVVEREAHLVEFERRSVPATSLILPGAPDASSRIQGDEYVAKKNISVAASRRSRPRSSHCVTSPAFIFSSR